MVERKIEEEQKAPMIEESASRETEGSSAVGMQPAGTYVFIEPVEFEGKTYEQVDYNLKTLKSTDVMQARRQASELRGQIDDPASLMEDDLLHVVLFALAANMPDVFINHMGASDYIAWATAAQGFFARALRSLVR